MCFDCELGWWKRSVPHRSRISYYRMQPHTLERANSYQQPSNHIINVLARLLQLMKLQIRWERAGSARQRILSKTLGCRDSIFLDSPGRLFIQGIQSRIDMRDIVYSRYIANQIHLMD
jgi:hypothetical protein